MVELMSPAGNFISLRAALENGADSVYIGLAGNNMRANVSNFSLKDVKEAVKIAKEYSSKIYLCTNTIMRNKDIKKLESSLELIKEYGVDALIVSDIGLAELINDVGITSHMSVQENISNTQSLKTLKKLGVGRVILSRELNIWEIAELAQDSPIETEIFIHGAICMAVSGRCFLSYGLYGKSANCGKCLQPCRKQWTLSMAENKNSDYYHGNDAKKSSFILKTNTNNEVGDNIPNTKTNFISPNDLAMIKYIPQLLATKVDAFKIEGRARGAEYVATATKVYREAIDTAENEDFIYKNSWIEDLKKVFNRGFDTGFYFNRPYKISKKNQSQYTKKDIAKVVNYYSKIKVAELKIWDDLSLGDEIIIQGKATGSITQKINSIQINGKFIKSAKKNQNIAIAINKKVRPNDYVYKLIKKRNNTNSI
jgi:putative protease